MTLAGRGFSYPPPGAYDALIYKGAIDCSANPNYPAADAGHMYKVSVGGKIGGASGAVVTAGDTIICTVDGSAAGTQAAVGANWNILQTNIDLTAPGAIGGTTPAAGTFTQVNTGYATVASHATTSAIWAAAGNVINFTGAETITNFPAAPQAGAQRSLICAGATVFTHGGNITVLGGATYTANANDVVIVTALSTTTFFVEPKSGRVKFPGGVNQDGIVFGSLGTATKGIDLSGSGLSGATAYWFYGDATNFFRADGYLNLSSYISAPSVQGDNIQGRSYGLIITTNVNRGLIRVAANSNQIFAVGNTTAVGSLTDCTSNGTTTITKATHGLTLAVGELVHITGATTTADKGFYRIISSTADTIVVDRALAGSDGDVALTVYKDVIGVFATDGTNGQRIMNYSAQNKPLQIGGDVLVATAGLAADDVQVGGSLGITDTRITSGVGTVNSYGTVNRQLFKVTTAYGAYTDSDATKGIVIATLPAKMKIVGFCADTTTPYTGGSTSAATLVAGITAESAAEILAVHDVLSGAVTKGLADADMGTAMTRAAQIQGGYLPSWTGTTAIYATLVITDDILSNLTAGSTTFYIETEQM